MNATPRSRREQVPDEEKDEAAGEAVPATDLLAVDQVGVGAPVGSTSTVMDAAVNLYTSFKRRASKLSAKVKKGKRGWDLDAFPLPPPLPIAVASLCLFKFCY